MIKSVTLDVFDHSFQEMGYLIRASLIPDVPDPRSKVYALFDFRSHTKSRSEPHGIDRAPHPHGGNFENLQMFKNPVLLSCTEIPANPGCSIILGILTT